MKLTRSLFVLVMSLFAVAELLSQQPDTMNQDWGSGPLAASMKVPRLIKFSGMLRDLTGKPLVGPVDVNFAIYKEQADLVPLWYEVQTLQLDEQGRYTVLLGAMQAEGLPMALFTSGEARWLEVAAAGAEPQPRTFLVSVPYALKAGDAETLGGKPASAFVLGEQASTTAPSGVVAVAAPSASKEAEADPHALTKPRAPAALTSDSANYIPMFTDNSGSLGDSVMYQSESRIGIGTTTPWVPLSVESSNPFSGILVGETSGLNPKQLLFGFDTAGNYASFQAVQQGVSYVPLVLQKNGGNVGIGTPSPSTKLGVETSNAFGGLSVGQNSGATPRQLLIGYDTGDNFASLQAVEQMVSFTPLVLQKNGGNVGIGTETPGEKLEVAGNVKASGSVTATSFVGEGSGLTNVPTAGSANDLNCTGCVGNTQLGVNYAASASKGGDATNALLLNGYASSAFQLAGSYATLGGNTFTDTQTVSSGNLSVSSGDISLPQTASASVGVINLGGNRFIHACCAADHHNTFIGVNAGNFTTTGYHNSAMGELALQSNDTGSYNNGIGNYALQYNTTGQHNAANGVAALYDNTTGSFNTGNGYGVLYYNTTSSNNTGVGFEALRENCHGVAGDCTGNNNTALGYLAGVTGTGANANVTGANNTFIGYQSGPGTATQLTNATAIGANALVSASNALVLGGTGGNAVNVGIGTQSPAARLEVVNGDVYASTAGKGVIVKSPDGTKCARIGIDDAGALSVTTLTCP
jgi:hypothetical protein